MGIVLDFLMQRKEKWLKEHLKKDLSAKDAAAVEWEAEEKFSLKNWIFQAAKQAEQVALNKNAGLATHVGKFTHPDAKASPILSNGCFQADGYFHSGNVKSAWDILGNASAAPVFDFLLTGMSDGETIAEHLMKNSREIREELAEVEEKYEMIRECFLRLKKEDAEMQSDERVRQVYFPVEGGYHLLSLLTASGLLTEVKNRISEMHERRRAAKDGKNEEYGMTYEDIYNLTEISFGGSKPQNISVLNSRNRGRAYLLSVMPPVIKTREARRPRNDFFKNTLRITNYRSLFYKLHALLKCERNNLVMREDVKETICEIIDAVMVRVYAVREQDGGWSAAKICASLPMPQKIWLDDAYATEREANDEWQQEVSYGFARWLMYAYKKTMQESPAELGDGEMQFLQSQIEMVLQRDKGRVE